MIETLIRPLAPTMRWNILLLLACLLVLSACGFKEARIKRERGAASHYQFGIGFLADKPPDVLRAHIEFQKATELDSRNREAHYALGHVRFLLRKYRDGITSFKRALSIDPGYSEAHNYLGRVYAAQGEFDLAIASYEAALKNPKYLTPEAPYWNLALVFMRQKRYRYAVQALNNALLMKPGTVSLHNLLGKAHSRMGQTEKAIEAFKEAIRITPDNTDAHYGLACAYRKGGNSLQSENEFNAVLSLAPELKDKEGFMACSIPDR
jgi:type IV pilus assembly protein PilF